jgi:hypothetical protein
MTTITVKQNGSGTMDQEIGASPQAMALLRNFTSSGDSQDKKTSAEMHLFGPEEAKTAAAAMGVQFVSGEPVKTAEVEGYRAHFAFDDITKVKFSMNKTPPSPGSSTADTPQEPPLAFAFDKKGGSSVLSITLPEPKSEAGLLPKMPGGGGSPQDNAMAMSMLLPMLRGLYVDVSLVVDGKIIKTNAPYVTGSQVTLVQFDFDKVSATEGALQKLQQITDPKLLKDIPGIRMPVDQVVTIEFGR